MASKLGKRAWLFPLILALYSLSCREARVRTIKLAHGLPPSHPVHQAMVSFAERVTTGSGGSIRVDVHPSEQLGTERECLELVQLGSIGMTKVSASVLESFVPAYSVFSLPYLFRDESHRQRVFHGEIGRELLLSGQAQGLRGLTYYDAGSRSFYSKEKPILEPGDLQGMKIRTQESSLAMGMVRALGGAATPIAWGELYTALQQGVVDGAENNPPSFHLSGHYEICKYYCLDEHTSTPDVLLIGTEIWEELSDGERRLMEEAARASAELELRLWRKATADALAAVREAGVEILRPDKAAFRSAVSGLYQDRRELSGLIERIQAVP